MSRTTPELESLDQHLRDAFRGVDLPAAPGRLRAEVESLPATTRNRVGRSPWHRSARHRSPVLMTLVAAAAVIALVAVALPVLRGQLPAGGASPTASNPAPTATPSPSPSPTAVATASDGSSIVADGPSVTWATVPLRQFGSNTVWAVGAAQVGGTLVVIAYDSTQNDMKPVIFESTNGTDWIRVPTDGAEFAHARLDYLLPIPGGLLLVGESLEPDPLCAGGALGCNPISAMFMWRSSDGHTWQRLPAATTAPFDRVGSVSMSSGPKGLVAFGLRFPATGVESKNVVLHSADGISWSSADFPDQNGGSSGVLVQQVIATPNGFVAVGSADQAPGSGAAVGGAAWYSPDGLTWTRATTPAGSTELTRYAAAGSTGMVATSNGLWVSADGKTWQTADTSPFTNGSSWITGDGDQILVISGPSVYWSHDGKTWHRGDSTPAMPDTGIFGTTSLAWVFGSTVIAVSPDDLNLYVGHIAGH